MSPGKTTKSGSHPRRLPTSLPVSNASSSLRDFTFKVCLKSICFLAISIIIKILPAVVLSYLDHCKCFQTSLCTFTYAALWTTLSSSTKTIFFIVNVNPAFHFKILHGSYFFHKLKKFLIWPTTSQGSFLSCPSNVKYTPSMLTILWPASPSVTAPNQFTCQSLYTDSSEIVQNSWKKGDSETSFLLGSDPSHPCWCSH